MTKKKTGGNLNNIPKRKRKKVIATLIHLFKPNHFPNKSYGYLNQWGIADTINGKLIFNVSTNE